jgi:signal recognition particle subunit SRP54
MVLEGLGKSLRDVIGRVNSSSVVDDDLVRDITRELQRALLQADVNVQLVLELTNKIQNRALNEEPPAGRSPKDHITKIIYEELVALLDNGDGLALKPQTIMMVGLYGQGKTTTTGKLANYFIKKGFSVGLIGADIYRPAALDQLKQLGEKVNAEVYGEPKKRMLRR